MASLRDIRNRIASVRNTQQVTRAMKMVSAAKMRRAQERIFRARPYAFEIGEIIAHLKGRLDPSAHQLFRAPEVASGRILLIIVTADRGMAGGFNSNIIKLAEQTIRERYQQVHARGDLFLICIGRKGHDHFSRRGYQLVGDFRGAFEHLSFETARQAVDVATRGYLEGQWDEVQVIYNEFRNTIAQNRIVEPLLPIPTDHFLTPVMIKDLEKRQSAATNYQVDYMFEPGADEILEALVPKYLNFQMWRILLESNAAEQGARMVAMESATSNAEELLRTLRIFYNRARQDAITKELIEITSGASALEAG